MPKKKTKEVDVKLKEVEEFSIRCSFCDEESMTSRIIGNKRMHLCAKCYIAYKMS